MTDPTKARVLMRLFGSIQELSGPADLDVLEDYAIILSQPEGMPDPGPLHLCKVTGLEGEQWYSFWRNQEGKIELIDEWTPTFPALLVLDGVEHDMIDAAHARSARRAARVTDPESSHRAVRNRQMGWDTMNMRALRIFYEHRDEEFGLSYYEVERLAVQEWGEAALGKSPWKRCSELHTDFNPPLIERVTGDQGQTVSVEGEFGDPVDAFRISAAGVALVRRTEPTA